MKRALNTCHFTKATSLSVSGWFVVVLNTQKCINIPQKRMGNWRTILRGLNRRITPPQKYMFYWKQKINVCWQTVGLSLLVKRIYVRFFMSNIAMDFLRDLQFFFLKCTFWCLRTASEVWNCFIVFERRVTSPQLLHSNPYQHNIGST